jgi:streptomycin 6-kinase
VADGTLLDITRWRAGASALAEQVALEWNLRLGEPYAPGVCGHVVRAELPDGTPGVLKVYRPDRETLQEPDALERWDGEGAVRLYARDDERHAMLLERCEPGTPLSADGRELDVLIALLPRLWCSGAGFRTLAEEAASWAVHLAERDRAGEARDAALHFIRELAPTQGELVLVHQDLHAHNVLAAGREPWLVIDPKPLAAEREFAVAPIVRSFELGHSRRDVIYRLDKLTAELGLDRDRARGWTIAQTVAWSGGSFFVAEHMETVEWLLDEAS